MINKGFEKVEAHLLPVTQEDLCTRRYADLESTLDSDDFSLDSNQSTEVDLFEEIRASIEKSNIMSNTCKSVCKSGVGEAHKQETHSLKKLDDISRNRDAKKNMVSVGQRKKISLGADHVKMGNKVATLGSGKDLVSKKSGLGNSCCSTSSTTSLESSSSVYITTTKFCWKILVCPPPSLSMSNHSSNDPAKSTRNFKPSGLRMPSPKIGFFDEDAERNGEANSFPHKSSKILSRMNMASAGQKKKRFP
ncbi:hypothetical protein LOK49_LG05G00857 [Camellia lanceoleosa]|uniref:Uncharacterized protein n=1 Tax=Camellia lanceoleosa TaxID=1840588 RepID=A0ACC0HLH7_9ERIC|nr:hypothetical protein LOK49_LG05G00857 [Camellia lanceoleosa]